MKMYVWQHVLTDHTDGMIVALASSKEEAKALFEAALKREGCSITPNIAADLAKEPIEVSTPTVYYVWGGG